MLHLEYVVKGKRRAYEEMWKDVQQVRMNIDRKGNFLTDSTSGMGRWRENFGDLMNEKKSCGNYRRNQLMSHNDIMGKSGGSQTEVSSEQF